jgi:hypothetical protein
MMALNLTVYHVCHLLLLDSGLILFIGVHLASYSVLTQSWSHTNSHGCSANQFYGFHPYLLRISSDS